MTDTLDGLGKGKLMCPHVRLVHRYILAALLVTHVPPTDIEAGQGAAPSVDAPAPPEVAGLVPGTTRRAEVELRFGVAAKRASENRATYAAPSTLDGAERLHIEYFPDQRIAHVNVELRGALDPSALASRTGNAVHRAQDESGNLVQYFFPSLLGFVHRGASAQTPVTNVLYLSPRLMADLFCERANEALKTERFQEAYTECDKAVLVSPEYARGYRCRAISLHRQGRTEQALEQWLASTRAPIGIDYRVRSWAETAAVFHRKGWKERAWEALDDARRLDPSSPVPYVTEARLRRRDKQSDQAVAAWEAATERAPGDTAILAEYADALYDEKRYADAAPHYRRLADTGSSDDAFTLNFRAGFCLSRNDQYSEAIPYYERALEMKPEHLWTNNNLGVCFRKTGQPGRALPLFEKALQIKPNKIIPAKNRIYAFLDLGQVDRAHDLVERLQKRHPKNTGIMIQMAQAYAVKEDYSDAMDWLERAHEAGYRDCDYLRSDPYLTKARKKKRKEWGRLCGKP